MKNDYDGLVASDRVSPQTRSVLLERLEWTDEGYVSRIFTPQLFGTLCALAARVIPVPVDHGTSPHHFAALMDSVLAEGKGDGWRYATLPVDLEAWTIGLTLLDEFARRLSAVPFDRLTPEAQDALLGSIAAERLRSPKLHLKRWFEDVRGELTKLFVSDPRTLARMGYSGIADDQNGFVQLGIGQVEAWEPEPR